MHSEGETYLAQELVEDGVHFSKDCFGYIHSLKQLPFFYDRIKADKLNNQTKISEVLFIHHEGPKIKRFRELSQNYRIHPSFETKQILQKDQSQVLTFNKVEYEMRDKLKEYFTVKNMHFLLDKNKINYSVIP